MNSLAGAVVLTKTGGILGPIAGILGWIMDLLFRFTSTFGIENIGLCIILFTLVTKILMMPLTIKPVSYTHLDVYKRQPISVVKVRSTSDVVSSSMVTRSKIRRSGSMVVSQSCSASISPRPL